MLIAILFAIVTLLHPSTTTGPHTNQSTAAVVD